MLAEFADPNAMGNWQSPILSLLDARQQPQVSVAAVPEAIDKISDQGRSKDLRKAHLARLAMAQNSGASTRPVIETPSS